MNGLFEKIYNEVIYHEKDISAMNKAVEKKNQELALKFKNRMDEKETDELLDILDDATLSAEKEFFYMGFCYAFRALLALQKG